MTFHTPVARKNWLTLSLTLGLLLCTFASWRAGARASHQSLRNHHSQSAEQAGKGQTLAGALNADGTVKAGLAGSFDASGYRMEYTATGAPRFAQAAACNGWDTQFSLPNGVNGPVVALVVSGTDIYVGGGFSTAGNIAANNVAKFNTLTNAWSVLGTGGGNGVDGNIQAMVMSGSDLYVGGFFITTANVGGTTVRVNSIAKVNTTTGVWSALGTGGGNGVNASVNAMALSGNDIYVGGDFTTANVGGATVISVNNIAKVSTVTGAWSALGTGGGNGVSGESFRGVYALAVSGDDLYVGGHFSVANADGTAVISVNNIAKVNTVTGIWNALGTGGGNGVSGSLFGVLAMAVSGSDLFVGGDFTTANVGGTTIHVNNIAKLNTITGTWGTLGTGGGNGVNAEVYALMASGGDLYVGGKFTAANYNFIGTLAVSSAHLAKYNTLTGAWSTLGIGNGNGVDDTVRVLLLNGSDLYAGGNLTRANLGDVIVNANFIAKCITTTGAWSPLSTGNGNGVNGIILAMAASGADIYVGGVFTAAGNIAANNVAKFNTLTNTWSALGKGGGNGVNYSVWALAVSGSSVYAGGYFTMANVGGTTVGVNRVAKFDTLTNMWSALGTGSGNGVDSNVYALVVIGNDLYVGGPFINMANLGGTAIQVNRVAKVNTITGEWSVLGTGGGNGVRPGVFALTASGNDLYVGGLFNGANLGGAIVRANNIAKYNTLTGQWSALGTGDGNGVDYFVYTLAVNGSDLYVLGYFTTANVGGTTVSVNNIAKFNLMSGNWSALGTGNGNGVSDGLFSSQSLAVIGSDLYVGGGFRMANIGGTTVSVNSIAKVNTTTGQWSKLADIGGGDGVNGQVYALEVSGNSLFVGGGFSIAGNNKLSNNIGRFCSGCVGVACPADVFVSTANNSAVVNYPAPTPNGDCGTITCTPAPGSTFNAGVTTVTCSSSLDNRFCSFKVTVNRVSGTASDPLVCTGPGNTVQATLVITNNGNVTQTVADTTTFTNLTGVPNTCTVTPNVGTCTVTSSGLTYNAALAAGQTVTITYLTQVSDLAAAGVQACSNNSVTFNNGEPFTFSACKVVNCPTAGPGAFATTTSPLNAQRPGSVLIYNIFTSSAAAPNVQNTRLSLTNTHPVNKSYVHLFFVDGATCSVADGFICLTPNQTASLLAADLDPGTSGYVVAVAVDATGCPINFNYLIGDEFVKFTSGHAANLGAEAVTAIAGGAPLCNGSTTTADLRFDGLSYSVLPHVLSADNIGSRADSNDTLLILNRLGGSLATGAATLTNLFGVLYDDAETPVSFSFSPGTCQFRSVISSSFPRTVPRFEQFIPAGRSGWFKVNASALAAMTGALINFNVSAMAQSSAFNQGHNLHKLTTTNTAVLTIPVFPPNC